MPKMVGFRSESWLNLLKFLKRNLKVSLEREAELHLSANNFNILYIFGKKQINMKLLIIT